MSLTYFLQRVLRDDVAARKEHGRVVFGGDLFRDGTDEDGVELKLVPELDFDRQFLLRQPLLLPCKSMNRETFHDTGDLQQTWECDRPRPYG